VVPSYWSSNDYLIVDLVIIVVSEVVTRTLSGCMTMVSGVSLSMCRGFRRHPMSCEMRVLAFAVTHHCVQFSATQTPATH